MIKGGGIAITGQEQRQLGGGFLEGDGAPPGKKKKKTLILYLPMFFLNFLLYTFIQDMEKLFKLFKKLIKHIYLYEMVM